MSRVCHTTYNAVNIVVYYLIVPLSWTVMLDYIIKRPYSTAALLAVWAGIVIATRHRFIQWCDVAFDKSVEFLHSFRRIGWNYTVSSVIICVIAPLIIYIILIVCLIRFR